jgi:hypothetical protein
LDLGEVALVEIILLVVKCSISILIWPMKRILCNYSITFRLKMLQFEELKEGENILDKVMNRIFFFFDDQEIKDSIKN